MTDLVIVRHAQSVWNAESRWQGWADPPLSALGEQQAADAGRALGRSIDPQPAPDVVVTSDLQRARQTAELLVAGLRARVPAGADPRPLPAGPLPPEPGFIVDAGLREYDTGEWTGLRRSEIAARWPEQLAEWDAGRLRSSPGGEDYAAFVDRIFGALERIRRAAPAGRVLAVSHGRAIHAAIEALGGPDDRIDHLSGWHLHLQPSPVLVSPVSLLA